MNNNEIIVALAFDVANIESVNNARACKHGYLYTNNNTSNIFSSPEHKVLRVSYCDRPLSVVVRRASCVVRKLFYLNIFSSETTHWTLTKLHRNDPWVVPYQSCSNGSDWLHK